MPGVSMKTICASGLVNTPWIEVRVVCGLSATIATFWPTRAFSSVDLPAFGSPIRETNPDLKCSFMSDRLSLAQANLSHSQLVRGQHFDANAIALYRFSGLRHAAQPFADQTAH